MSDRNAVQPGQFAATAADDMAEFPIPDLNRFTVFQYISQSLIVVVSLLALVMQATGAAPENFGGGQRKMFVDVPAPKLAIQQEPTVSRRRVITIDPSLLRAQRQNGARLLMNFFDDAEFEGVVEQVNNRSENDFSLMGKLHGESHSSFVLSYKDGVAVMNLRTPKGMFHLRHLGNSFYEARQIDETKFPPCANNQKHGIAAPADAAAPATAPAGAAADVAAADAGTWIDVLVVYTPASRAAAGGTAAMEALINLAIDESNIAYQQSQITTRLRLVHQEEVAYVESGSIDTDLSRLTSTTDGFIDQVHTLRNTYGADLVSLMVNDGQYCGVAWIMRALSTSFASSAFSCVYWGCATGYYSFAHELGHNMGCEHDRANASTGLYPYSYGWRFTGSDGAEYRTIMSYAPGTRIQYFSNPNVTFLGTATGVPAGQANAADNAQTINNSASTVANFRSSVIGCINTSISPTSTNVPYSGGTGTVTVTALDSCSWTPVSGSPFITVTGGGTGNGSFSYTLAANPNSIARTGTVSAGAQTFTVVQAGAPGLADVLDATNLVWTTGGYAAWSGQYSTTHDGIDAARSGSIIRNQQTYLETTINGPVNISFWWKVSSESGGDLLKVAVDGVTINQISGEVDWQIVNVGIPSGTHAVRWTYSKNNNVNAGSDAAWLDQVVVLPPDHLVLMAGDNQTALAGSALPVNPKLRVVDAAGTPVPGVAVNFSVESGGGMVSSPSVLSSTNGLAWITNTLGTTAGTNRAIASAALPGTPNSITFTAVGLAGPAHHLSILAQPSPLATAGAAFTQQPVVRVEDQYGNLRTSDNTTAVNAGRAAGAGLLQGTLSVTASGGIASFSNLAHLIATNITIAFTSAGLAPATSSFVTIAPAAAARLAIKQQPSASVTAGIVFPQQPVVRIEDVFGNLVNDDNTTTVTAARVAGSGTLQGDTDVVASAGVATFANLSHLIANNITLNFSGGALSSATSAVINVDSGPLARLQLLAPGETNEPGSLNGSSGTPLPQTVGTPFACTVTAVDLFWNPVSTVTHIVSVSSSDPLAVLPANTPLIAGTNKFMATFKAAGLQTLTITDVSDPGQTPAISSAITVNEGDQSIVFPPLTNRIYGDSPFALSATAPSGLPINFSIISGPATVSGNVVTITGTGNVTLQASQDGDANWNPASSTTQSFSVSPALLSVMALSQNRPYGSTNPSLTGTLNGIKNGDPITAIYATTALPDSPAGAYPITAALEDPAARLSNYTIENTSGILTVTRAITAGVLVSSANPELPGTPVTFTHTLNLIPGGTVLPEGLVQFKADGTNLDVAVTLSNGIARHTTASLTAGWHAITAEYSGSPDSVGVTNSLDPIQLINTPPVAAFDTIERPSTNGFKVAVATLLTNDVDADGDSLVLLSVVAASANGAGLILSDDSIFYEPPARFTNTDSFTYTIQDSHGATASATVYVGAHADSAPAPNLRITDLGDGTYGIHVDGIPGRSYSIQYGQTFQPVAWNGLTNITANAFGTFEFIDAPPTGTVSRFYRAISP